MDLFWTNEILNQYNIITSKSISLWFILSAFFSSSLFLMSIAAVFHFGINPTVFILTIRIILEGIT